MLPAIGHRAAGPQVRRWERLTHENVFLEPRQQGFVLTRHWRGTAAETHVAFWRATDDDARQAVLPVADTGPSACAHGVDDRFATLISHQQRLF